MAREDEGGLAQLRKLQRGVAGRRRAGTLDELVAVVELDEDEVAGDLGGEGGLLLVWGDGCGLALAS